MAWPHLQWNLDLETERRPRLLHPRDLFGLWIEIALERYYYDYQLECPWAPQEGTPLQTHILTDYIPHNPLPGLITSCNHLYLISSSVSYYKIGTHTPSMFPSFAFLVFWSLDCYLFLIDCCLPWKLPVLLDYSFACALDVIVCWCLNNPPCPDCTLLTKPVIGSPLCCHNASYIWWCLIMKIFKDKNKKCKNNLKFDW